MIDDHFRTLGLGWIYPYHGENPRDKAEQIACAILYDMGDRRGIKSELLSVDRDVRRDIVETHAAIIRRAMELAELPQFDDYDVLMSKALEHQQKGETK